MKSLDWYLLQESLITESDISKKYGDSLIPPGRYTNDLKLMIATVRQKYKATLASDRPSDMWNNMGCGIPSDWVDFFTQRIFSANQLKDLVVPGGATALESGKVVSLRLDPKWRELSEKGENSSRRFIAFYFSQILKALKETGSDVRIDGFDFRINGNIVSIVKTKE